MRRKTFEDGVFGEDFVKGILERAGIHCRKNPYRDKNRMIEWDLACSLGDRNFAVEVKFDRMEAQTGNVAVEYYNVRQGRPSGILATTSDLWVFVLNGPEAWACRTKDLRDWFDTQPCHREVACGGDDNAAMRLYRREVLFPAVFRRLDGLEPDGVVALVKEMLVDV